MYWANAVLFFLYVVLFKLNFLTAGLRWSVACIFLCSSKLVSQPSPLILHCPSKSLKKMFLSEMNLQLNEKYLQCNYTSTYILITFYRKIQAVCIHDVVNFKRQAWHWCFSWNLIAIVGILWLQTLFQTERGSYTLHFDAAASILGKGYWIFLPTKHQRQYEYCTHWTLRN